MRMNLTQLPRGQIGRITRIEADEALTRKFLELGIDEGLDIRVLHEGPIRRDPIAIEVQDRCIALRRKDASHIMITVD